MALNFTGRSQALARVGGAAGLTQQQTLDDVLGSTGTQESLFKMSRTALLLDNPKAYFKAKLAAIIEATSGVAFNTLMGRSLADLRTAIETGNIPGGNGPVAAKVTRLLTQQKDKFKQGGLTEGQALKLAQKSVREQLSADLLAVNLRFPKSDELVDIDSIIKRVTL